MTTVNQRRRGSPGKDRMEQEIFMKRALELAREAAEHGEVPVGCVVVKDGRIIGEGRNQREEKRDVRSHAELEAMAQACKTLGSWRLEGCDLYVTLEPCPMCAGAIINGRMRKIFYGARDEAMGACGGVLNLFMEDFPCKPQIFGNILGEESREILGDFFKKLRNDREKI